jgi:uncharacterized membrane protein HdeD (DUF308 family)
MIFLGLLLFVVGIYAMINYFYTRHLEQYSKSLYLAYIAIAKELSIVKQEYDNYKKEIIDQLGKN